MTQRSRVEESLLKNGYATRNQFLRQIPAITRLGAIICDMRADGWQFEEGYSPNKKDYQYKLVKCPYKKVAYTIGGQVFVTWNKK
jgi:hypothetical protein